MGIIKRFLIKLGIIKSAPITHRLIVRYFKKVGLAKCHINFKKVQTPKDVCDFLYPYQYDSFKIFFKHFQHLYAIDLFNKLLLKHDVVYAFYKHKLYYFTFSGLSGEEILKKYRKSIESTMLNHFRYYSYRELTNTLLPYDFLCPPNFSYEKFEKEWKRIVFENEILNWMW